MTRSWISKILLLTALLPWSARAFQTKIPIPPDGDAPIRDLAFHDDAFMAVFNHLLDFQPRRALDALDIAPLAHDWDKLIRGWAHHQMGHYGRALEYLEQVDSNAESLHGYLSYRHTELIKADTVLRNFDVMETEHFSIRYQPGKDRILLFFLPRILENAYAELSRVFSFDASEKIIIEIMPDHELFSYASALDRSQIETTSTIALCVENRLVVLTPRRVALGYYWPDTVCHELVHYVLNKMGGAHVPLWLHEGIAKSFENRWRAQTINPLDQLLETRLARALERRHFVTFEEMHPSFAALPTAERAQLAYAQVASMVHFLVETHGRSILSRLVEAYAGGEDEDEVFARLVESDLSTFRTRWTAWAQNQGYEMHDIMGPQEVTLLDEDHQDEALSTDDVAEDVQKKHVRLGDLLLERHRHYPALREYQKAIQETEQVSRQLQLRFLTCYDRLGYHREMLDFIEDHVTLIERDATMLTYKAQAQIGLEQFAAAHDLLLRAVHINPFDPKIHVCRKTIFERLGQMQKIEECTKILNILSGLEPPKPALEQES